jgi:hypothetical protein
MNYFAHALPFLDDPYFAAGTGVPDWLSVVDRRVRVRLKSAVRLSGDSDRRTASVAGGAAQHIRDDAHFHASRPFAELSWELTARARDALGGDEPGFRPALLGHLLVEVLLDASLIAEDPRRLEAYYRLFESVDPRVVQEVVNRMAARPTGQLAVMISEFFRLRILSDYHEDGKLMGRLNQVMRRVKQPQLPEGFCRMLPEARRQVDDRKRELLEGIPTTASAK